MNNSFFSFKQFTIRQEEATLKVTTDSCILGAYATSPSPLTILDIGTGTGILAIMAAQRFRRASIEGIEPDPVTAQLARKNAMNSPWPDRIKIITSRIQDYQKEHKKKYELIICNPPYHESQLTSKDKRKNLAKHSVDLTLSELAYAVNQFLCRDGNFFAIATPLSFRILEKELSFFEIRNFDRMLIYNVPSKPLYRIIGGFGRGEKGTKVVELLIKDNEGNYTPEFRNLLKDFYQAF
jgi:tRNA1Val (adenine37-N6)-methyltransferase